MPLLSPQDIHMLRQRIQQTIQTIFLAGAAWLLLVLVSLRLGVHGVVAAFEVIVFAAAMIWSIYGRLDDLHQDLKNGTKLRLETTVEAKLLVGGISPTIVVRGEKQAISRASYNSLQVGDCVRLEIAPRSRTFLSLQKI
jgi:hypothetical protein